MCKYSPLGPCIVCSFLNKYPSCYSICVHVVGTIKISVKYYLRNHGCSSSRKKNVLICHDLNEGTAFVDRNYRPFSFPVQSSINYLLNSFPKEARIIDRRAILYTLITIVSRRNRFPFNPQTLITPNPFMYMRLKLDKLSHASACSTLQRSVCN